MSVARTARCIRSRALHSRRPCPGSNPRSAIGAWSGAIQLHQILMAAAALENGDGLPRLSAGQVTQVADLPAGEPGQEPQAFLRVVNEPVELASDGGPLAAGGLDRKSVV